MTMIDVHRPPPPVRRIRVLARALLLAAALVAVTPSAAPPALAIGPLPPCRLADIRTVPNGYDDWSTTLVDWLLSVGPDYRPPDLVPVSEAGLGGGQLIRRVAIDDLRALASAAARAGHPISVIDGFRSFTDQAASFNGWVARDSYEHAITYSQRPGHSEHQLGLAIDVKAAAEADSLSHPDWATTPTGKWMLDNAWTFGWVLSYPKSRDGALWNPMTCFHYEPWQYRYLGRTLAARVHASGMTIREYLWTHATRVDPKTGKPIPTPTPRPSPTPTPAATPPATPSPTSSPTATATPAPADVPVSQSRGSSVPPEVLLGLLLLAALLAVGGVLLWRAARRQAP